MPRVHRDRRRRSRRGQACRLTLPYRCHEWPCEWYPLSACPCVSCVVAVLGFTLVCLLLKYQGIRLLFRFRVLFLFVRFTWGCSVLFMMKSGSRSFACWFCLDFSREIVKQTNRSKGMYKVNRRNEVCRLFGCQKHTARHRNYRQVLNFRLRCRRKTKNRLPPKNYRRIALPPKEYRHILVLPPPPKSLPQKNEKTAYRRKITAVLHYRRKIPPYFCFTASAKVVTAKKWPNRLPPKSYWHMAIPPCLCPPKKSLPRTTLNFWYVIYNKHSYYRSIPP